MISSKRVKKFFRHFIFIENGVRWVKRQLWGLFCRAIRAGKINAYLRAHPVRKLQIGAGHAALDDWLNTDFSPIDSRFVYLDARRRFPFPDDSFDYIFCEHLIEHLSFPEARYMMGECFRVLKPGGKIRVSTPDLDVVMGFLAREKTGIQERYIEFAFRRWISKCDPVSDVRVVNDMFRNWGHRFIYNRSALQELLEAAGFAGCTVCAAGESGDPHLRGIDRHGRVMGDELNRFVTLVMEAAVPPAR